MDAEYMKGLELSSSGLTVKEKRIRESEACLRHAYPQRWMISQLYFVPSTLCTGV